MTLSALGYGTAGYGRRPYAGYRDQNRPIPDAGQGFASIIANDRYQLHVLTASGSGGRLPAWRYWMGGAVEWSDILAAHTTDNIAPFYATDELGQPVEAVLELQSIAVPSGVEATISGVLVEFTPRPSILTDFDGGVAADATVGVTAYTEGFRAPQVLFGSGDPLRLSGVLRSDEQSFSIPAADIAHVVWPNRIAVYLECRINEPVRSYRAGLRFHNCSIRSVEIHGNPTPSRLG